MAIEQGPDGALVITGEHLTLYRLLVMRSAMMLDMKGIRMTRRAVFPMASREFGLHGSKAAKLAQFEDTIRAKFPEWAANHPKQEA